MVVQHVWFMLLFYGIEYTSQHWSDSTSYCTLATDAKENSQTNKEHEWISVTSHWLAYEGCYWSNSHDLDNSSNKHVLSSNSPHLCSLMCSNMHYFGIKGTTCICFTFYGSGSFAHDTNCDTACPHPYSNYTCGSGENGYFGIYEHFFDFRPRFENDSSRNCIVLMKSNNTWEYQSDDCSKKWKVLCLLQDGVISNYQGGRMTFEDASILFARNSGCNGISNSSVIETPISLLTIGNESYFWTNIRRHDVLIWTDQNIFQLQVDKVKEYNTTCLSIDHSMSQTPLPCCIDLPIVCSMSVMTPLNKNVTYYRCGYGSIGSVSGSTNSSSHYDMPQQTVVSSLSDVESTTIQFTEKSTESSSDMFLNKDNIATNEMTDTGSSTDTFLNNDNTAANNTTDDGNYREMSLSIFTFHIAVAVVLSVIVVLAAVISKCASGPKRDQSAFPNGVSLNSEMPAVEHSSIQNRSSCRIADIYSCPWDDMAFQSKKENINPDASGVCLENQQNKDEENNITSQYHHLDFTLRSEKGPNFVGGGEYGVPRTRLASVFDQPWDSQTSKVSKLFSQLRQSVVKHGREIHNSLLRREASVRGHADVNEHGADVELNNTELLHDTPELQTNNDLNSKDNKDKHGGKDMSCNDLTHMYAEPVDKRVSMKERVIQFVSTKFPFGIKHAFVESPKQHSKLQSARCSIEEVIESEV